MSRSGPPGEGLLMGRRRKGGLGEPMKAEGSALRPGRSPCPMAALSLCPPASDRTANVLAAARALLPHLARGRPLERRLLSTTLTTAFGGSDADGAWNWRDAYDAVEAALVMQVRRLEPQVAPLEAAPGEVAALLDQLAGLSPTHSRRSEDQVALDQFSTPLPVAAIAALAAQVRPGDRVLEPSAGTGQMAAIARALGGVLTLNEFDPHRAGML